VYCVVEAEVSLVMGRTSAFGLKEVCAKEVEMIKERNGKRMRSFLAKEAIGTRMKR